MRKAPDAFRTISEASDALKTPAHVLRFWESKFSQVKPVKRAGGRRYYRPADIDLLSGIRTLLHDQGMTIRGVQKLISEKGVRHVAHIAPLTALSEHDAAAAQDAYTDLPEESIAPPEPAAPIAPPVPVRILAATPAQSIAPLLVSGRPGALSRTLRVSGLPHAAIAKAKPLASRMEALLERLTGGR